MRITRRVRRRKCASRSGRGVRDQLPTAHLKTHQLTAAASAQDIILGGLIETRFADGGGRRSRRGGKNNRWTHRNIVTRR